MLANKEEHVKGINETIEKLVDEGWRPRLVLDPFEYPRLRFYKEEVI